MRLLKWPETRFNSALDRSAIPPSPNDLISQAHVTIGMGPNASELPIRAAGARWQALPIRLAAVSRLGSLQPHRISDNFTCAGVRLSESASAQSK